MVQDTTYQEKFAILSKWLPTIIQSIKKDIKNDHLRKDQAFHKQYMQGRPIQKMTNEELVKGYIKALESDEVGQSIAEFITNRWLLKNSDVYYYFEGMLKQINPDFTAISSIDEDFGMKMVNESSEQYGAIPSYIFCRLNEVALSDACFAKLEQMAEEEEKSAEVEEKLENVEQVKRKYEQLLARNADRYEKKLSSLEKKYVEDTESLKRQIANLQRKLNA